MNHSNEAACKLCQKVPLGFDNFEKIDQTTQTTINSILAESIESTKDGLVCVDCGKSIRHFSEFKSMCLNTEERIKMVANSEDDAKLTLKDVLQQEGIELKDMSNDQKICRFCMTVANKGSYTLLSGINDTMFLNNMKNYMGTSDLSLTAEPVVCESCLGSIQRYFDFSKNICPKKEAHLMEGASKETVKEKALSIMANASAASGPDPTPDIVNIALLSNAVTHSNATTPFLANSGDQDVVVTQCPGFYYHPHVNIIDLHSSSGPVTGGHTNDSDCCGDDCNCCCDDGTCEDCQCGDGDCGDCDCGDGDCGDCDCGDVDCGDCVIL